MISIKDFINRLEYIKKEPAVVINIPIRRLFFWIMYKIACHQVSDTSQARACIIRGIAENLGGNFPALAESLKEEWRYWETLGFPNDNRDWNNYKDKSTIKVGIGVIEWLCWDEGVLSQEEGVNITNPVLHAPPSPNHPRDADPFYVHGHISFVTNSIEQSIINDLCNDIRIAIEYFIRTGTVISNEKYD